MTKLPYIADHRKIADVLERFYAIGEGGAPDRAELDYIREIDRLAGPQQSFPQKMETLCELLIVGLHSFQPLSEVLQERFDATHEEQIVTRLKSGPRDKAHFASVLRQARRGPNIGIVEALPTSYSELDLPNLAELGAFWADNLEFIHPLILASETARHVKVPVDDPRRVLIGLDAFRQAGMPLVLELPLEFEHKLGTRLFEGSLTSDFGQVVEFAYENVRQLLATILGQGRSAHQGTGNGFAILAEQARVRQQNSN